MARVRGGVITVMGETDVVRRALALSGIGALVGVEAATEGPEG